MINRPSPKSDIRIDAEGSWFYRGAEMIRQDIVQLFYQNLTADEAGQYFIRLGSQIYPVEVEDTPFVVREIAESPEGSAFLLTISDGSEEPFDPGTFHIGANDVPYCRIRTGLCKARFSKAAYYGLAGRLEQDPGQNLLYLDLNGQKCYLGSDHDNLLK